MAPTLPPDLNDAVLEQIRWWQALIAHVETLDDPPDSYVPILTLLAGVPFSKAQVSAFNTAAKLDIAVPDYPLRLQRLLILYAFLLGRGDLADLSATPPLTAALALKVDRAHMTPPPKGKHVM